MKDKTEMQLLLQSMRDNCSNTGTDSNYQMLLLRDGMLFSLLWQLVFGGCSAGAPTLNHVVLPTSESAVPHQVPDAKLQAAAVLNLLPDTTKNKQGGH